MARHPQVAQVGRLHQEMEGPQSAPARPEHRRPTSRSESGAGPCRVRAKGLGGQGERGCRDSEQLQ